MICKPHFRICWLLLYAIAFIFATGASAQEQVGSYLVKLRDQPVVAHLAHQNGRTKGRVNLVSPDAASYRSQLLAKQETVKRRLEALPQAEVRTQMDTVFNGIVVALRDSDVDAVKQYPEVEEVIRPLRYRKALDSALSLAHVPEGWMHSKIGGESNAGVGVRIAIIDTGIDISHPMLQDPSLTPPSGYPRFTAPTTQCLNSDQRFTNSKVIVARNYVSLLENPDPHCDAEDRDGHGTFVASLAAGRRVQAPLASLAGVAPKAFLGSYKVFGSSGVNDSATLPAIVKAMDDAVKDGMHIINLSLGAPANTHPISDPLAVTVALAVEAGVTVVVAAGNSGPGSGTISSPGISPVAITVGSSTNSRTFANLLTIGSSVSVPQGIQTIAALPGNGPEIRFPVGPSTLLSVTTVDGTGLACSPLPPGSLSGRVALIQRGCCRFSTKIQNAFQSGALAAILYNNQTNAPAFLMDVGTATQIPAAMIGNREGVSLEQFLAATGATVTASLGAERRGTAIPANRPAGFSSNGPSTDFGIKPDLVTPGTSLYAATQRNDPSGEQYDANGFAIADGTSFSTGIISGAAALVRQASPTFTPAQIKAALVNSAAKLIATADGNPASVLVQGNGLLDLAAALNAPAIVAPVSISFGAQAPGSFLNTAINLSISNVGFATDTFTITVVQTVGSGTLNITPSPSSFILGGGATVTITVNANSSQPLTGTFEGFLSIQSQNSQRTIMVPYWGTFLRPTVSPGGVVNAASYSFGPSSVAAGSLISIFGTDLVSGNPTVKISGIVAPVLFSSSRQINAQVPFELQGGSSAEIVVQVNGVSSTAVTFPLAPAAPGIFTLDQSGQGYGAILHNSDFSLVTPSNPARPGEVLAVFATGLGAVFPAVETGIPAVTSPISTSLPQNIPSATIGGVSAPVKFSGLAPCFLGLYQVNVEVPAGASAGELVLILTSNGLASNPVKLPVAQSSSLALGTVAGPRELQPETSVCSALLGLTFPDGTG